MQGTTEGIAPAASSLAVPLAPAVLYLFLLLACLILVVWFVAQLSACGGEGGGMVEGRREGVNF